MQNILSSKIFTDIAEDVDKCKSREKYLLRKINSSGLFAQISYQKTSEPMVAVLAITQDMPPHKYYRILTENAFRKLLSPYRLETYNRRSLLIHDTYVPGNKKFNSWVPPKKSEEDDGEPAEPMVKKDFITVADIWLESEEKLNYDNVYFNPSMSNPHPRFLNVWSGFRYPEERVRDFDDWTIIRPFLNHLKWSWCDSEEQYVQLLRRLAYPLQNPGKKSGVVLAVGGEEGTGKTGILLKIKDIIGEAHSAHIHDVRDVFGEFNAPLMVRALMPLTPFPE